MKKPVIYLTTLLLSFGALDAWTITILNPEKPYNNASLFPDGSKMSDFMNLLSQENTAFSSSSLGGFDISSTDAVIVNLISSSSSYSTEELSTLAALLNSDVRVLIFGENSAWDTPNAQLAELLGGTYEGAEWGSSRSHSATDPSSENGQLILNDVNKIWFSYGIGKIGVGDGDGEALTSGNAISLWGTEDNFLVAMDSNFLDNDNISKNSQLAQNIADFLNGTGITQVPEPSTWAMMLGGSALGLVALRRRKNSRH